MLSKTYCVSLEQIIMKLVWSAELPIIRSNKRSLGNFHEKLSTVSGARIANVC